MPILRAGGRLILYAHVPKCGGTAVEDHLTARFGPLAFLDTRHMARPEARRWTRTSPQHVDRAALGALFPPGFFDHAFAIVRHPVARIVSAWHFQREVERTIPAGVTFSDWLEELAVLREEDPFAHDNHVRPMDELVPAEAQVFHLEHGLDALVPWLDAVTGDRSGPRAILPANERKGQGGARVVPGAGDLDLIATLYAADFARFGYAPDRAAPAAPAPLLDAATIAERDAELARHARPAARLRTKLQKAIRR